jgi:hypothetical protein
VIEPGSPVPEAEVFDGEGSAPLPVFFDGPTLLMFFRDDCRRCEGMVGLAAAIGRRARGLTVIGVSQETIEATAELLEGIGVRLPVVIDDRPFPASAAFGFTTVPAVALIEIDRVSWLSDGCSETDLQALTEWVGRWLKDEVRLHPDYADAPPSGSRAIDR